MTDLLKRHRVFFHIFIGWLFCFSTSAFADFTASVNRTNIGIHDTIELTLRTHIKSSDNPDLSGLSRNFDILGTRQNRQVQIINGKTQSWRDWVITLSPKKTGSLTIPPISLDAEKSDAITISVNSSAASSDKISPVFMKATLDSQHVYTQEQILLTLKIYTSINLLNDSRLSPLSISNAIITQLGKTEVYDETVDGIGYTVFQLEYAISPQKAGKLIIPPLSFVGTIANPRDPFGGVFAMSGKPIVARSSRIVVDVQAPPENYTGYIWLPAKHLTLTQRWSQPLDTIKVGDAVTRTITLTAEGLNAAQLPPLRTPSPKGVNVYPDQTSTKDSVTTKGVVGKQISAIAMVPTKAGTFHLPPIKVTWFDTQQKKTRVAELAATTITVQPSTNLQSASQPPEQAQSTPSPNPQAKPVAVNTPPTEPVATQTDTWQWITGIMISLWLITLLVLLIIWKKSRDSRQLASASFNQSQTSTDYEPDEATAFGALQNACVSGEKPELILECFKQWTRLFVTNPSLITAHQCAKALESESIQILCEDIDASIYSGVNSQTAGDELLSVCSVLRKTYKKSTKNSGLDELYPE